MKPTMLSFHIRKSSKIVLDKDCGTIYLSLTKCKSDMIQLDGLTDPFVVQYYYFFYFKAEIYNFIFAGFPCESMDVVTFLAQPQVSLLITVRCRESTANHPQSYPRENDCHILLVRGAKQVKPVRNR